MCMLSIVSKPKLSNPTCLCSAFTARELELKMNCPRVIISLDQVSKDINSLKFFYWLIFRERGGRETREGEKRCFVFPLDSCMCPDRGLNPRPWCIRTMLWPTDLPNQGGINSFYSFRYSQFSFILKHVYFILTECASVFNSITRVGSPDLL